MSLELDYFAGQFLDSMCLMFLQENSGLLRVSIKKGELSSGGRSVTDTSCSNLYLKR